MSTPASAAVSVLEARPDSGDHRMREPEAYGTISRCIGGSMSASPASVPQNGICSCSDRGTITHSTVSRLREITRRKLIPQSMASGLSVANRIALNGILNSADQPSR